MAETTRREYLKSVAGGTLPGVLLGVPSNSSTRTTSIVVKRDQDGPIERKEVPRSWNEHVQRVRSVQASLERRYADVPSVVSVERVRGKETFGGKTGLQIRVEVDRAAVSEDGLPTDLPDEVDGVTVQKQDAPEGFLADCEGHLDNINPAVGGIACSSSSGGGTTTVGANRHGNDADDLLLTAAHIFTDGDCSEDPTGRDLDQGGNHYGTVDDYDGPTDWAIVDGADPWYADEESKGEIKDEQGEWDVVGWYGNGGIDDLISENRTVYKMGTTTGQTAGTVEGQGSSYGEGCVDFDGEGVTVDIYSAQGDSGGPVYDRDDDGRVTMIAMVQILFDESGSVECGGADARAGERLRGTAFDHFYDEFGIYHAP